MTNLRDADPLQWLVACEEIRQLAAGYANAINHRDLDALVLLFVPDVRVGDATGRDALRDNFASQLSPTHRTILQVTTQSIDVTDSDNATGIVGTRAELERDEEWLVQVIEYHDTYRRQDGRWLFERRRHLLWYGADMLSRPVGLPAANWPQHQTGKGVLPEIMPSWQQWRRDHP